MKLVSLTGAAALFTLAIGCFSPLAQANPFGEGLFWTHNNSWMTITKSGRSLRIRYDQPRSGLRRHGVRRGTVLFRGRMSGQRIRGTAYTFKRGCQPASYNVSGRLRLGEYNNNTIVLKGAAPVREGCEVVGYTRRGSNARLIFNYAGTGD